MEKQTFVKWGTPGLILLAALAAVSCEDSDPVAVGNSEIILTASPNPIILSQGSTSNVTARVLTTSGVPQEGVRVFFSTTNGQVSPEDDTTDSEGRAFTVFSSSTTTTATITARSGGTSATLTIPVQGAAATSHVLTTSDAVVDTICTDVIQLSGTVLGGSTGIAGAQVTFQIVSANPSTLTGTFNPTSTVTTSGTNPGNYSVNFTLNSAQCQMSCTGAPSCQINVRASAAGLDSNEVPITDNL